MVDRGYADAKHKLWRLPLRALRLWYHEGTGEVARRCWAKLRREPAVAEPAITGFEPPFPQAEAYRQWIADHEPGPEELVQQRLQAATFPYRPLISVLTPVYNTPVTLLKAVMETLQAQTYGHWEICFVDGNSPNQAVRRTIRAAARRDRRIRYRFLRNNGGISANTNAALAMARGEFIALLDHDDLLAPFAFFEVARRLNEEPQLDFLYSDKDECSADGQRRFWPLFKPEWSPELILSANFLTHLNVIRTANARAVGGFRPETDGAQDWDFFLRVLEQTDRIAHIPKILYHWRHWSNSVASGIEAKPYALAAQQRTIAEHLQRTGRTAEVIVQDLLGVRLQRVGNRPTSVAIIVAAHGSSERLPSLLPALRTRKATDSVETVAVYTDGLSASPGESTAALLNHAVQGVNADVLLFLDEQVEPLVENWLDELLMWIEQPGIGVVGGKLLYPDGRLHQGCLTVGLQGIVGRLFHRMESGSDIFGRTEWYRNCLAVGGECLMIRRDFFTALGGFDESYQRGGHDVDLCLRVFQQGRRIVHNPLAAFRYHGPASEQIELGEADHARLRRRCGPLVRTGDPYFNHNLSRQSAQPRFGTREAGANILPLQVRARAG